MKCSPVELGDIAIRVEYVSSRSAICILRNILSKAANRAESPRTTSETHFTSQTSAGGRSLLGLVAEMQIRHLEYHSAK